VTACARCAAGAAAAGKAKAAFRATSFVAGAHWIVSPVDGRRLVWDARGEVGKLDTFRVLLDDPAAAPALGYDDYARAFSDVIRHSQPQFAIGIFGDWGSGKTTLMRAIERQLDRDRQVVCVWFNAWRYEREADLIVPLLDTLREQLASWASRRRSKDERDRAGRAAAAVARAARALVAGTSLKAGIGPAGLEVSGADLLAALRDGEAGPLSFYHRSFNAMSEAIADFVETGDDSGPRRRVVVFIDDLDRCLPDSALQVLESMKLFFDLSGFIFVVGLDRGVIERSIEAKYGSAAGSDENGAQAERGIKGADYIKKIFQVPFGLPRIGDDDLEPFFKSIVAMPLPEEQRTDLRTVVWPHIQASSAGSSVNPREVKRLINAYTLQMKMLTVKLKPRKRAPDPNVVLALQAMAFRADWERFYDVLTSDPPLFVDALGRVVNTPTADVTFPLTDEPLPRSLLDYIRTTEARSLLTTPDLDVYVTTAESTRSSDPAVLEAQGAVAELRRMVEGLGQGSGATEQEVVSAVHDRLSVLSSILGRRQSTLSREAAKRTHDLVEELKRRAPQPLPQVPERRPDWAGDTLQRLTGLQETLAAMRQEAFVGSAST
jgi:hypothetical protein